MIIYSLSNFAVNLLAAVFVVTKSGGAELCVIQDVVFLLCSFTIFFGLQSIKIRG